MAVYKVGSTGEQVKQIQKALGLKADGIFGRGTEATRKAPCFGSLEDCGRKFGRGGGEC